MSAGQEFWIVAAGPPAKGEGSWKEAYLTQLKKINPSGQGPWKFDVPDGDRSFLFGSFDSLIRLTDDLQKHDSQVDSIVHRLERQFLEIDPNAQFKVISQRQQKDLAEYLKTWQWDEAKYPKSRPLLDNLAHLMSRVNSLDEEARNKTAQYNDYKSQRGNLSKKDGANLLSQDLVDVLTPDVVQMKGSGEDDFIYTKYLTTVAVIVPRGTEKDFLKVYEGLTPTVVPRSAKCFKNLTDKDGNQLWRVVLCKEFEDLAKKDSSDGQEQVKKESTNHIENFKRALRERRYVPRDFEYSEEGYKKLMAQRDQLEKAVKQQHDFVKNLYSAAWSDAMVAWVHVKAMRVFVESVLRFGMPPRFASFILTPKPSAIPQARKSLAAILGAGQSGFGDDARKDEAQDEEEYYPYVSLTFVPFTAAKA